MKKFEEEDIQRIINWNKKETSQRKESFGVKIELLQEIIEKVNQFSSIPNEEERMLQQTSSLIGLIVFWQPFNNANKATAMSSAIHFLRSNEYELDLRSEDAQDELLQILNDVMYLFEDESEKGVNMVSEFMKQRIIKQ
jgi:prophage maintenance system killer protein